MKYTLTILLIFFIMGAKAQIHAYLFESNTAYYKQHNIVVVSASKSQAKKYAKQPDCIAVIKPNICEDCTPRPVLVRVPLPPTDMMIRHYFGISYWN